MAATEVLVDHLALLAPADESEFRTAASTTVVRVVEHRFPSLL